MKENNLDELTSKLLEIADKGSFSMPEYKMKHFVGDAQITDYSKLKQWFMELRSREDGLKHLEILVEKLEIEIEIEKEDLEFLTDARRKRLAELRIDDLHIDLRKYQRAKNDANKERDIVLNLIKDFINSVDNSKELILALEDPELREKYETEYWTVRMAKQAMLDMVTYGRLGTGNLDSILMMTPSQQRQVLSLATRYTMQIDGSVKELLTRASMNEPLGEIEAKLKEQLKLTEPKPIDTLNKLM